MNRLQKKCIIASTGLHLLLVVILFVGPAFLSSSSKTENVPELNFMPSKFLDELASNPGGSKGTTPPMPTPQIPQPLPPVAPPVAVKEPVVEPTPVKPIKPERQEKETKPEKTDPDSLEPAKPTKHKIVIDDKIVVRNSASRDAAKVRAAAEAKAIADERRQTLTALKRAVSGLEGNLSGSTEVKLTGGLGSGVSYGNWLSAVKKVYTDAWIVPDGVTDDSATATASVIIARDGEVLSTSITRFSGSALVDQSVKATLDRVRYAPPLPETAKEDKRTVTINFNVKAKQGLG